MLRVVGALRVQVEATDACHDLRLQVAPRRQTHVGRPALIAILERPTMSARRLLFHGSVNGDHELDQGLGHAWNEGAVMNKFKRGNALKATGFLLVMGTIAAALFLGPALRKAPDTQSVELPSMSNIPSEGSLFIETE